MPSKILDNQICGYQELRRHLPSKILDNQYVLSINLSKAFAFLDW